MAKKTSTKKKATSKKPAAKPAARTSAPAAAASRPTPKRKAPAKSAPPADKKKRTTAKSSASAAAAALAAVQQYHNNGHHGEEQVEWTEAQLRKVKTGLKKKDLDYFRDLLVEKRTEILGDVASIKEANAGGAGNLSNMPLHMADVGSDNYEQEFALGLVEWERKLLNEIDHALDRINKGTFGVCQQSGVPIPYERLEIKPWARFTIEVVRERERRGLPTT